MAKPVANLKVSGFDGVVVPFDRLLGAVQFRLLQVLVVECRKSLGECQSLVAVELLQMGHHEKVSQSLPLTGIEGEFAMVVENPAATDEFEKVVVVFENSVAVVFESLAVVLPVASVVFAKAAGDAENLAAVVAQNQAVEVVQSQVEAV